MEYVIIDNFNDTVNLATGEDGNTRVFNDVNKAIEAAKEYQRGIVVPLTDILGIMRDALNFISVAKFNLQSEEDDTFIEHKLEKILYETY